MSSANETYIPKNYWIAGWNTGLYGKNLDLKNIRKQPEQWRLGYIIGSKERENRASQTNHLIKRLIGYKKVRLNLE